MFVPVPPSVNLPPYYFDPYALGRRLHMWTMECLILKCIHHCLKYMPSPYTPTPHTYNMPYGGDPSFMNLLTIRRMTSYSFSPTPYREPVFWDGSTSNFWEHQ
ncbi:hypothetical protein Scep_025188 [Stephania cephalantha]|uniref:Uncharacterized protein n=1 Tax=Stephania cephalantha TaxID=152367 RepID=A0AAP0HP21_9MAGN